MQLFEIHEQAWFPGRLRDLTTDALQFVLNTANIYAPIVYRLRRALAATDASNVLDLCSGAGGPWLTLWKTLEQEEGRPFEVCCTDKFPNAKAFASAKPLEGNRILFRSTPVDATKVPGALTGFRTIFSSFHHFRPAEARAILEDAVKSRRGIAIFEAAERSVLALVLTILMPIGNLILTPFMRPFRWSRLLWTYAIPVVPFLLFFDGVMSCLRTYSVRELIELTSGLRSAGYEWKIGQETGDVFPLPITYLIGYPVRESARATD
jgi:hypothetical protein